MGSHPLWQLEDLLNDLRLQPGSRVLDLGCGHGATSVYLARECNVEVTAIDLWVGEDELRAHLRAAGVSVRVTAMNGNAAISRSRMGSSTPSSVSTPLNTSVPMSASFLVCYGCSSRAAQWA